MLMPVILTRKDNGIRFALDAADIRWVGEQFSSTLVKYWFQGTSIGGELHSVEVSEDFDVVMGMLGGRV